MANRKQIDPRRPIPANQYDKLRENLSSGFAEGFPSLKYPGPDIRPSVNRADLVSRKDDKVRDVSVGLQDHDEAVMYYFNEVIKPSVMINGNRTNVPIIYVAPERWKGVQQDGYYRDKEGKIQTPLIMFKRDGIEKRRDLGNKLDGNSPQLFYQFEERFTRKNQYDNFFVLQGRRPRREFYAVAVPDFVRLTYSCIIWTDYVIQMNKLIEMINYTSDAYWGDPEKFKFNARIDTYDNITEINQGENRIVKTNFGLTLQGYLVPDSLNKELETGNLKKRISKAQVLFQPELIVAPTREPKTREQVRNQRINPQAQSAYGQEKQLPVLAENIEQIGTGVGYQIIGESNKIT